MTGAVVYAKDLPRLSAFYAAVTGMPVQTTRQGFAVLGRKPFQLVIVQIPRRIADTISIETPPARREDAPIKLVFAVSDMVAARNAAAERGGAVNAAEREWEFEGFKVCDGHDPEGNVFALWEATQHNGNGS